MHSYRILLTLIATALAAPGVHARSAKRAPHGDPKAIQEVISGKRKVANAAWWGFDPVNATAALQAAIRSGAATVIVPNVGKPWIIDPIFLESNQEIDFESGVEIQARRGGFRGKTDALFTLEEKTNVAIKGYGAVLSMHKEDYRKAPYVKAEWRHCLAILCGTNIKISGITCANSGGDGVSIDGTNHDCPFSKDIVIKDVISENNYRQAISVMSVDGLLIEGAILRGTEGTKPGAGIDFEPYLPKQRLVGITMKNCVIEKNDFFGILVAVRNLPADFAPVQITIEGGRVTGNGAGALAVVSGNAVGAISFRSTELDGKRSISPSRVFMVQISTDPPANGAP